MSEGAGRVELGGARRISVIALMSALALVGTYALAAIPNVELGSVVLFTTAYAFGFGIAATCVLIMSLVYGTFNPWGVFIPQIWITQVIGWTVMVAAGHMLGIGEQHGRTLSRTDLGSAGLFTTLFFDLITNLGYSYAFSVPYGVALIMGALFTAVHSVSNAFLFPAVAPGIRRAISQIIPHTVNGTTYFSGDLGEE